MPDIYIWMFATDDGVAPFEEWLSSIADSKTIARIEARLARVRAGNSGDYRDLGGGLLELRLMFGPGYRIYFAREGECIIILLAGGDKGSQPTDIVIARSYLKDFRRRNDARSPRLPRVPAAKATAEPKRSRTLP